MTRLTRAQRRAILALSATVAFLTPACAHADPITATIVAVVNVIGGATIAAAVGNFLIAYGAIIYSTAASWALSKVSGAKAASAKDRQASVATLSVGEVAREALVGEAGTGGSLVDGYYYGGKNGTDWNVLVIAVADHRCHALTGYYVQDTYRTHTGDGVVPGYNGQLKVWWRPGAADDAPLPPEISGLGPAVADGALRGVARVIVAYQADAPDAKNPIWTTGRPSFVWVVKGLLCYDPRKDDTVEGGFGGHRWDDPSTREWSENAEVIRYNIARGIYFLDQVDQPAALMLGRGLTAYEAPPERVAPIANVCDELVEVIDAETGETRHEPRYRVGGVIGADQTFDTVEQWFADAMGGHIVQPEGGVAVEPGYARNPVADITDNDLVVGEAVQWSDEVSDGDRINSVVVSYVEPDQKFAMTTAGVLRDEADIVADGGPKELQLSLVLVRHRSQALRIGEIRRRSARLEKRGALVLGPEYAGLEEGDWITYTSERRTGGQPITMRVARYGLAANWRNSLALEQTAFSVYGAGGPAVVVPTVPVEIPPGALALDGVSVIPILLQGENDSLLPAVAVGWETPVDSAITTIRVEVRLQGQLATTPTSTTEVNAGQLVVTNGVPPAAHIEVRLVPLGAPGRSIVPSNWISVTTGGLVATDTINIGEFTKEQLRTWTQLTDLANANSRDALIRVANAMAVAEAADQDLLGQIRPASGRPIGATLDDQVRIVEDNTQAIAEHYVEMTVGFANAAAALSLEMLTRATADEALSVFQINLAAVVADNYATVTSQLATLTTNQSATATALTALTTNFNNNVASVSTQLTTLSNAQSAQASSISSLSSTVSGHTSSISFIATTLATLNGQVGAAVGVNLTVDGRSIGWKGINSGATGGWVMDGDYFFFRTSGGDRQLVSILGDLIYLGTNVRIGGNLVVEGTIDAPQLASRAATSVSRSSASWVMSGSGGYQTLLSHYVYLSKAGTIDVHAAISQHFPSGDRSWALELYIDGGLEYRTYGANAQDSVPLSGSRDCAAGYRLVEILWSGHSSTNVDYRSMTSMASW
ncbi:hypothetical protein [Caulobacter vibrioides]|uniref:hypothetical protein n=1 Tax=Caulobacter vibrioides TaxID=155892 RepID=UPI000BB52934|nr:hypothetical protein [Caulobacter vibrioides]ATC25216.1 hypothetical protein CA608_12090 [Caulobacter vibrioides]PLR13986.1 hypothetical protein CVUC_05390 [Caulobacter vibrioides]